MLFEDMLGQQRVKKQLLSILSSGDIGHAYVFSGTDGIGKHMAARQFAAAIMCMSPSVDEGVVCMCGECTSCKLNVSGTNPDLIYASPEEGKATLGVEAIRDLTENTVTAPVYGKRKVYIVEHSEKMNMQAQNAFLKTLEEPPMYMTMILLCSNTSLLLDTVKSRVQTIEFERNTDAEVMKAYNMSVSGKQPPIDKDDIRYDIICSYSDGIIGRALSLVDFDTFESLQRNIADTLMLLKANNEFNAYKGFTKLFEDNTEQKEFLYFSLLSFFRDIAMYGRLGDKASIQNRKYMKEIRELSQIIDHTKALDCMSYVNTSWMQLTKNVNYKMSAGDCALKITGKGNNR